MNAASRIPGALAVLAVIVMGCNQLATKPTAGAGSISNSAPAPPSPASSVAATGQPAAAPEPPVEFTGRIKCGPPVREGTEGTLEVGDEAMVLARSRGGAWRQTVTMSDPRLEGDAYHTFEADEYRVAGAEEGVLVWAATLRIENEAGAWETRDYGANDADGSPIGDNSPEVWIGEGAYAGLIAIMEGTPIEGSCGAEVRGIIFDGAPTPEPYNPG